MSTARQAAVAVIEAARRHQQEAREGAFGRYMVAEWHGAPVRWSGEVFALFGREIFSTDDKARAEAVAVGLQDKAGAGSCLRFEVRLSTVWARERVEQLDGIIAAAEHALEVGDAA